MSLEAVKYCSVGISHCAMIPEFQGLIITHMNRNFHCSTRFAIVSDNIIIFKCEEPIKELSTIQESFKEQNDLELDKLRLASYDVDLSEMIIV